ncbi:MAG: 30S ribosomal protein S2 [Candidatus Omnitrophota bacterium]
MSIASQVIRDLLENGVHFGHQTNKWNPKMKKYIFGAKSGIYIIDLKKTEEALRKATEFIYELAGQGKIVLFAGTKKQAKQIIREEAQRCGMFFIDERWLGGCLTNFTTIRKSVDRLNQLQERKKEEVYENLAKKEKARVEKEEYKLLKNLEGIRDMNVLPDCLVVVDTESENIAIKEAKKIGIPVIALIDTNCDPDMVDFPIPGNDDAIRSIKYILGTLADAVEKGRSEFMGTTLKIKKAEDKEETPVPEEKTETEETAKVAPVEIKEEIKTKEEPKEAKPKEATEAKEIVEEELEGDISI